MKHLLKSLVTLTFIAGTILSGITRSAAAASNNAAFAGTWEGRLNNLPAIKLKIQEAERKTSGEILFYFQKRDDPSGLWHVAGENVTPLLAPHVEGKTLTFEVQHHRCHGCQELGPNVKFRMALTGTNEAQLWNLNEGPDSGPGLKLVRQTEDTGSSAPPMQKGISAQLPVTSNAVPVPEADNEDALILTVTYDGSLYLGVNPIHTTELPEKLRRALSNRAEKTLYVKADARIPYANLVKVLDSVRMAGVERLTLLTSQRDAVEPGTLVSPRGIEMLVISHRPVARSSSGAEVWRPRILLHVAADRLGYLVHDGPGTRKVSPRSRPRSPTQGLAIDGRDKGKMVGTNWAVNFDGDLPPLQN